MKGKKPLRTRWSTLKNDLAKPYWTYEDIGIFFLVLVLLGSVLRLFVRIRLLPRSALTSPSFGLQFAVVASLSLALYWVLKIRHHQPVLRPLGWVWPRSAYIVVALLGGALAVIRGCTLPSLSQSEPAVHADRPNPGIGCSAWPHLGGISFPGMFTAGLGPDHQQPSVRDLDRPSVCPFPPARQPGALGIVYRDWRRLWLDPSGFALHYRRGVHACHLQLGSSPLGQVLISRTFRMRLVESQP